jgi:hypothetical protein
MESLFSIESHKDADLLAMLEVEDGITATPERDKAGMIVLLRPHRRGYNIKQAHKGNRPWKKGKSTDFERKYSLGSIEIAPGQYATMLTGNQTWNAVHNGTAVSTTCVNGL